MYTRIRKSLDNKDKGFTLIELLVVIVIIGILAAIAIPIFLNQRKKAADASAKSDVRTIATALETAFTDNATYPLPAAVDLTAGAVVIGGESVRLSPNNTIAEVKYNGVSASATGFCVRVTSSKGSAPTVGYTWLSNAGGLQSTSPATCVAADAAMLINADTGL